MIVQQYLKIKLTLHALQSLHRPKLDPENICRVLTRYSALVQVFSHLFVLLQCWREVYSSTVVPTDVSVQRDLICSSLAFVTSSSPSATFTVRHLFAFRNVSAEMNVLSHPDWCEWSTLAGTEQSITVFLQSS